MQTAVKNHLNAIRLTRGVGAADLAARVGVSRQTIYAIEAGTYVPNTEVTLKLARELEVPVEELFSLIEKAQHAPRSLQSEVLSETVPGNGQAVQVCKLGHHTVSVPVNAAPYFLPEADGVISGPGLSMGQTELAVLSDEESFSKRLVVAGCDPAIGLLARMVERLSGVQIIAAAASSRLALSWLKAGKVHIAGTHLRDTATGEFNVPIIQREYPDDDFTLVTFAQWEEGFVTAHGNPKRIRKVADLARSGIQFINREPGSGSRGLLDTLLEEAGIPSARVRGYDKIAHGHLAAAYAVCAGEADCCLATRSAARTFNLHFTPVQGERYDFVLHRKALELPAVQTFLDVLQKANLRRQLEVLAGYDTTRTGFVVA